MKNFKNLLMTFIGIIAVAMCATSCLNSEDDTLLQVFGDFVSILVAFLDDGVHQHHLALCSESMLRD